MSEREDDVTRGPDGGAKGDAVDDARSLERSGDEPVLKTAEHPVATVGDVVDQASLFGWQLALQEAFEEALADLGGGRRLVPAARGQGELPGEKAVLAAVVLVAPEQEKVHGRGADGAGDESAGDGGEGGRGGAGVA